MSLDEGQAPALRVDVTITVGRGAAAFVARVSLTLGAGVLVLFGPSGSGKTLTLEAIAGLLRPASGSIYAGSEALFLRDASARPRVEVPAHRRRVGYVPQHASLFPFATVAENVAFGLPRAERKNNPAIEALMAELGVAHLAGARPTSLSGGERQRVALARALAVRPRLLLLDEPFAALDRAGRVGLRRALAEALKKHGTPAVFVTHDEEEALELGDVMVLLDKGAVVASGSPAELLGRARRPGVLVSGDVERPGAPLSDGRMKVALRDAVIEGPAELFEGDRLQLDLIAREPQ